MLSRSSSSNNYSAPNLPTMNWRSPRDYGASTPNYNESNSGQHFSGSRSVRSSSDSRGAMEPQRSFGRTSSFGSDSFPAPQRSSLQIVYLDNELPREFNPLSRQIPPPRPIDRLQLPLRQPEERYQRSSSRTEQHKALENLKREFYNPNTKRITNRVNLYYRDTPVNPNHIDNEEDRKRCAICLEDFERGQEVMVTPCKHMFHEECIVPWAKSNAQCPVCRFVFGPKTREPATPFNSGNSNSNIATVVPAGLSTQEFFSIIRALGDGFQWGY
ncbi:hypothetical protein TIFTF001_036826 [Ficus carica]|uniref:RING-type domain-containing protein n=1 Tax=Ficus carica TaxID=3494 RepID=A0AA88E4E1_FICCA|nr:hypothetical protein TIFTF001_036788 [Ficus carica]GMN67744.1 hypothetical protein TIFTF001_036799 [Ficus carica]GMN67749.1 hypothetical protein TIFTF001_036811 [Ficus carica]GMN67771.1 hypothetical protein TIFTF001_036826 [Ficus carica]